MKKEITLYEYLIDLLDFLQTEEVYLIDLSEDLKSKILHELPYFDEFKNFELRIPPSGILTFSHWFEIDPEKQFNCYSNDNEKINNFHLFKNCELNLVHKFYKRNRIDFYVRLF